MNWLAGRLLLAWLDSRLRWVGPAGIGGRSSSLRFFFSSLSSVTDDPVPLVDVPLFLWLVDPACQRLSGSAAASLGSATRRSWVCRRGVDAPVVHVQVVNKQARPVLLQLEDIHEWSITAQPSTCDHDFVTIHLS